MNTKVREIITISHLRQDTAGVLRRGGKFREPVVIMQRGRAAAVMLSIEEFEKNQEERDIL